MYLVSLAKLKKNIANMCCLLEGGASSKRLNSLAVQLSFLGGGGVLFAGVSFSPRGVYCAVWWEAGEEAGRKGC